jgi:tetratricopeptide (TPR) repeat protein
VLPVPRSATPSHLPGIAQRRQTTVAALLTVAALVIGCGKNTEAELQQHRNNAERLASEQKYPEAIIEYRNAVRLDARNGELRKKLADAYVRTNDPVRALRESVVAADLLPDDVIAQLRAGALLLMSGRFEDAKSRAEQALTRAPGNVDAQLLKANAMVGLKDMDAAIAQVEEAITSNPERGETYANLGALQLDRGKIAEAETAFKRATELEPTSSAAHLALANFYWQTGQWKLADEALRKAREVNPKDALTNRALAAFYIATNRGPLAEAPLKAIADYTESAVDRFALADFYVRMRKTAEASAVLEPLTKDTKTADEAAVRLATIEYRTGKQEQALRRLDTVINGKGSSINALLVKTMFLMDRRSGEEAVKTAAAAVALNQKSVPAQFTLGRAQMAAGRSIEATAAFEEVLRLNPRMSDAKILLSQLYLGTGAVERSLQLAQESLAGDPNNPQIRLLAARARVRSGDLQQAEIDLADLAKRFPTAAPVQTQLGMLAGTKGDAAGARRHFSRALELRSDDVEALTGLVALDLQSKDVSAAVNRVKAQVASKPTAPLLLLAARTYAAAGDSAGVEQSLKKALEIDNDNLEVYAALGQYYASRGKNAEARAEFEKLASASSKPAATLTMIGMLYEADNNAAAARAQYEKVLRQDPNAAVAANNLAWLYATAGTKLDEALKLAMLASTRLVGVPQAADTLGMVNYKLGAYAPAITAFNRAIEAQPENAVYHYHLGLAYAKSFQMLSAKQSLTRALSLSSNFVGAEDAKRVLGSLGI